MKSTSMVLPTASISRYHLACTQVSQPLVCVCVWGGGEVGVMRGGG